MNKIIVYFPYPFRKQQSGSQVRPVKILEGFKQFGKNNNIEIICVSGESRERQEKINEIYRKIDPKSILFCYMENSTLPFWLTDFDHIPRRPLLDIKFFRYLKKHQVPFGIFYRDIYWKFDDEYPLRGIKKVIMQNIYRIEKKVYERYASHFFLPSLQMNKYTKFDPSRTYSLPPGGEVHSLSKTKKNNGDLLNVIYVGGISERYGLRTMLETLKIINRNITRANLLLVCRKNEYDEYKAIIEQYKQYEWLKIYHAFGEDLISIYQQSDVGIIPRQKTIYNDFAVPVKLFEYLSFGLPIIATNCDAQAEIISNNRLGIVTKPDSHSLAEGLKVLMDSGNLDYYRKNVQEYLINKGLWIHRVEKVFNILTMNKQS